MKLRYSQIIDRIRTKFSKTNNTKSDLEKLAKKTPKLLIEGTIANYEKKPLTINEIAKMLESDRKQDRLKGIEEISSNVDALCYFIEKTPYKNTRNIAVEKLSEIIQNIDDIRALMVVAKMSKKKIKKIEAVEKIHKIIECADAEKIKEDLTYLAENFENESARIAAVEKLVGQDYYLSLIAINSKYYSTQIKATEKISTINNLSRIAVLSYYEDEINVFAIKRLSEMVENITDWDDLLIVLNGSKDKGAIDFAHKKLMEMIKDMTDLHALTYISYWARYENLQRAAFEKVKEDVNALKEIIKSARYDDDWLKDMVNQQLRIIKKSSFAEGLEKRIG